MYHAIMLLMRVGVLQYRSHIPKLTHPCNLAIMAHSFD